MRVCCTASRTVLSIRFLDEWQRTCRWQYECKFTECIHTTFERIYLRLPCHDNIPVCTCNYVRMRIWCICDFRFDDTFTNLDTRRMGSEMNSRHPVHKNLPINLFTNRGAHQNQKLFHQLADLRCSPRQPPYFAPWLNRGQSPRVPSAREV